MQNRLAQLRSRLLEKIRNSELRSLEQFSRGEIYATVVQETNHLSQSFPLLISAAQSLCLLAFCLAYIAVLSGISFLIVFGDHRRRTLDVLGAARRLIRAMASVHGARGGDAGFSRALL